MGFPIKAIAEIALKVAGFVIPAVRAVESIAGGVASLKGQQKQDAAVQAIRAFIETTELVSGRDLVNDAEVERATRAAIDAIVALQNVVAKKAAPATP